MDIRAYNALLCYLVIVLVIIFLLGQVACEPVAMIVDKPLLILRASDGLDNENNKSKS